MGERQSEQNEKSKPIVRVKRKRVSPQKGKLFAQKAAIVEALYKDKKSIPSIQLLLANEKGVDVSVVTLRAFVKDQILPEMGEAETIIDGAAAKKLHPVKKDIEAILRDSSCNYSEIWRGLSEQGIEVSLVSLQRFIKLHVLPAEEDEKKLNAVLPFIRENLESGTKQVEILEMLKNKNLETSSESLARFIRVRV